MVTGVELTSKNLILYAFSYILTKINTLKPKIILIITSISNIIKKGD